MLNGKMSMKTSNEMGGSRWMELQLGSGDGDMLETGEGVRERLCVSRGGGDTVEERSKLPRNGHRPPFRMEALERR